MVLVEMILETLTLNKRRSQAFYKHVDVHSVTNAVDESISSINIWNIVYQLVKYGFSCGSVINKLKERQLFLIKWIEIVNRNLVLSRGDFWIIWMWHGIMCFHFYFLFRNNGIREQLDKNDFCRCCGNFFSKVSFRKYLITAMFKVLFNNYETRWQWHLRDTLQLKILRTWIIIGVEPAPRHLIYYSMLLFLSSKPSF